MDTILGFCFSQRVSHLRHHWGLFFIHHRWYPHSLLCIWMHLQMVTRKMGHTTIYKINWFCIHNKLITCLQKMSLQRAYKCMWEGPGITLHLVWATLKVWSLLFFPTEAVGLTMLPFTLTFTITDLCHTENLWPEFMKWAPHSCTKTDESTLMRILHFLLSGYF